MLFEIKIAAALLIDQLAGDPRWFPHPVRMIGWFCLRSEEFFRTLFLSKKLAGFCTVISVVVATITAVGLLLKISALLSPVFADCVAVLVLYTSIAGKDLIVHSRKVYDCLRSGEDLSAARKAVSMIVGRDTENLDTAGVSRACVETVAENMVDGVTAPLFLECYAAYFLLSLVS